MPPQRLPIVNSDDGTWGDILRQYLLKEHYDDGDPDGNAANGGHKTITIRAGTASTGTAPLKFSSGNLLTAPEAGAVEFYDDQLYFTQTTDAIRKTIASYDDESGAAGDIYYRDGSGYFTRLGIGDAGEVLTASGGIPIWADLQLSDLTDASSIVTTTGVQTLTNKTLTAPKVNVLADANGNNLLTLTTTASAANYLDLRNNIAGFSPTISAVGTSSNIHINLIPKGVSGRITENGVEVATVSRVQTFTNKTLASPAVTGDIVQAADRPFLISNHTGGAGFAGGFKWQQSGSTKLELFYDTSSNSLSYWNTDGTDTGARMVYDREGYMYLGSGSGVDSSTRLKIHDSYSRATSGDVKGLLSEVFIDPSGSATTRAWGVHFVGGTKPGNAQNLTGGDALMGFEGKAQHNGTGTVTGANGGLLYIENTSTGTITNARTLNLFPMANANGGTVTNAYHLVTNGLPSFSANNQTRIAIDIASSTPSPGSYTGTTAAAIRLSGDNGARDGILFSNDVTLYRSAADTLKTDDNFIVGTPGTSSGSVATVDGTQTLTNKTLEEPNIVDTNSNQILLFGGSPSAVNRFEMWNASSGAYPAMIVSGDDSDIGFNIMSKGAGPVSLNDGSGNVIFLAYPASGTAVNYVWAGNATTGNAVSINSAGTDTDVDLELYAQGAGEVRVDGAPIVTTSAAQTLTNKTLTSPTVVDDIYDENGNVLLGLSPRADATRWMYITNSDDGWHPFLNVEGEGADIDLGLAPKGTGRIYTYQPSGGTTTLLFDGTASDISVNFDTKGSGIVQANGIEVTTISGNQTLTNKRVTNRVGTIASAAEPAINTDISDTFTVTALATNISSMTTNLTGTPTNRQKLLVSIKDDGAPRAIAWGSAFQASGTVTPLATTVANMTHHVGFVWDSAINKWVCLACDDTGY